MINEQQKDEMLWGIAKLRAGFKASLISYFIINAMLNVIWYLSSGPNTYYWPVWPMLGWGVGLAFQYFHAYHGNKFYNAEAEYNKLKNKSSQV